MVPYRIPGLKFAMTPRPDTHDSTSSSAVTATGGESSGRSSPCPDEKAEETTQSVVCKDGSDEFKQHAGTVAENPYLSGLSKKTRGLKKKLEKIKKTESMSASGKVGSHYYCCSTTHYSYCCSGAFAS